MPGKDFDDYMKRFEQLAAKYVPPKKDWGFGLPQGW